MFELLSSHRLCGIISCTKKKEKKQKQKKTHYLATFYWFKRFRLAYWNWRVKKRILKSTELIYGECCRQLIICGSVIYNWILMTPRFNPIKKKTIESRVESHSSHRLLFEIRSVSHSVSEQMIANSFLPTAM